MDRLRQDLRYALGSLRSARGFAAVAVLTLAVGIGANTAIFSIVDAAVIRPMPYAASEELFLVWPQVTFTEQRLGAFLDEIPSIEDYSGFGNATFTITGDGEATEVSGGRVAADHFSLLRAEPLLGRTFAPGENYPANSQVVLLSHQLWTGRYGSDPAMVGRTLNLNGSAVTVVGVMPESYHPLAPTWQLWMPFVLDPTRPDDGPSYLTAIARIPASAGEASATAEVRTRAMTARQDDPDRFSEATVALAGVVRLRDAIAGNASPTLCMLLGAGLLIMLIVCGNVANLLMSRSIHRRGEIAIRAALGGSPARILRQLLTESLVLGLAGALAALPIAFWGLGAVGSLLPNSIPRAAEIGMNFRVLGFGLGISILASLVFGLVPAVRLSRASIETSLRTWGGRSTTRTGLLASSSLVAVQIAISMVLVVGSWLLVESLWNLGRVDPGFHSADVVSLKVAPVSRVSTARSRHAYYTQVLDTIDRVPGVQAAGGIHIPPMGSGNWNFRYVAEDTPIAPGETLPTANFRIVTPGYFRALGIPMVAGRDVEEGDLSDSGGLESGGVGLVNESLAHRLWPGEDPIGKRMRLSGPEGHRFTVVGVVGDIRQFSLSRQPRDEIYWPAGQWTIGALTLMVRTDGREGMPASLREAIWSVDGDVPVSQVAAMDEVVSRTTATSRFYSFVLSALGGVSLFLAALGVYGVTSFAVRGRTREIGMRIALGAPRDVLLWSTMFGAMVPVLAGIGIGVAGALATTRFLATLLFGVTATDPTVFAGVAVVLLIVGVSACYVPARLAAGLDPLSALRVE